VKTKILNFSNVIISEELRYITILNFFGSPKNRQVTHLYYVLSHFLRESVSERIERIERGAMIEKYFYEEFRMESLKFKGTNEEFKGENYVYL
jgi:hypothetical protein